MSSGRSCSAALKDFFVPEANPAERVVHRREPGDDAQVALQRRLQLRQREVGTRRDQSSEVGFMRRQQRSAMAAKAGGRRAAGRPHPLHQFDRRRRADGKPPRVQRHRCRHDPHPACLNRYCRITGADSMQQGML
jgi:hypothetical protein